MCASGFNPDPHRDIGTGGDLGDRRGPGWYLRQKPVGGSKAGGFPHLPFPSPPPFHSPYILSLPVGGKVKGEVPRLPTLQIPPWLLCAAKIYSRHGQQWQKQTRANYIQGSIDGFLLFDSHRQNESIPNSFDTYRRQV